MTAPDAPGPDRVVQRAVRAGLLTAGVLSLLTALGNLAFGGDGYAAAVWVSSSLVVGTLVSAGWLVLAAILDLASGRTPGRRRIAWTAAAFATAFLAPILPAAVLQVAATR